MWDEKNSRVIERAIGRMRTVSLFGAMGDGSGWSVELSLGGLYLVPSTCKLVSGTHWIENFQSLSV